MSLIAEIREHMSRQSGPVHPKQVAEALDQDVAIVRNTMNQANTKGHGIERDDDGTFSLIPGWAPSRGPNAVEPAAAPAAAAIPAVAAPASSSPAKARTAATPAKAKRGYVRKEKPATERQPTTPTQPPRRQASQSAETVQMSRGSLALLVDAVLASDRPITPALRAALRETASHAIAS
jgi:hypothetical protein